MIFLKSDTIPHLLHLLQSLLCFNIVRVLFFGVFFSEMPLVSTLPRGHQWTCATSMNTFICMFSGHLAQQEVHRWPWQRCQSRSAQTRDRIMVTAVICACSITGISCLLCNVSEQLSHCQVFLRGRVMAAGAPSSGPTGQSGEEQTVVSFHWKHMVKLKCVIYLGLRVATEEHAHTCAFTRVHRGTHTTDRV